MRAKYCPSSCGQMLAVLKVKRENVPMTAEARTAYAIVRRSDAGKTGDGYTWFLKRDFIALGWGAELAPGGKCSGCL